MRPMLAAAKEWQRGGGKPRDSASEAKPPVADQIAERAAELGHGASICIAGITCLQR